MDVEVAYAKPEIQVLIPLRVEPDTTARSAIELSGIEDRFPELTGSGYDFGVFGKIVAPHRVLRPGDRVEIYRPLIADPKQVRKERAAAGKRTNKGAGQGQ
jgi:putative ubiquitin-RnfH superfamily antitoxin RatB of RatAB toxin-antitoxin module